MKITEADMESNIEALAHTRLRPQMWLGNNALSIESFRMGFIFGLGQAGIEIQNLETEISSERGWEINAARPSHQMKLSGMSEEEITVEVLTILILAIQRLYSITNEPILKTHRMMRERAEKALAENRVDRDRYKLEIELISNLEKDMGL